ncbi:MAG TPA: TfoX/Sxy family protein [Chitinophagaceae bacterium]|nr:TfoX/Sxy family protein [Chitinophagaceae bacterium]
MAYNIKLADRITAYLNAIPNIKIKEKKMFRGLTFMIDDKMCVCVSGENLMCRFDPISQDELSDKIGFQPMVMKDREYKGYCYVSPDGIKTKKNFEFWLNLCLNFNKRAKSSKKQKQI